MNWYLSSAQTPNSLQVSMGGGYSPDIKTIIEAHANTTIEQLKIFKKCTNYSIAIRAINIVFLFNYCLPNKSNSLATTRL
jgi:hypothetical protein